MPKIVLIDAGPIVAYLMSAEGDLHRWAIDQFRSFNAFTTCQAVLAEACARLAYHDEPQSRVIDLVASGQIKVNSDCPVHRIRRLLDKYEDRPMDLADACLVVMLEDAAPGSQLITLDRRDFLVYRMNGREKIPFIAPRT